jgi:hypothetical protein
MVFSSFALRMRPIVGTVQRRTITSAQINKPNTIREQMKLYQQNGHLHGKSNNSSYMPFVFTP